MLECRECGAPLAHDQRYCVSCGARRGGLPERISKLLAPLDMPVPPALAGIPPMYFVPPVQPQNTGLAGALDDLFQNGEYLSPRVAAVAVFALLAFGVLMGSVIGPSTGLSPIYVLPSAAQTAAAAPEPAAEAPATESVPAAEQAVAPAAPTESTGATSAPPVAVKHVWMIVLSDQGYAKSFGDAGSQSYLVSTLAPQGAVLPNYYAVAQGELANNIALVSGQGPTWQITQNCPNYTPLTPGTIDAASQQAIGEGCVFPENVQTIGDAVSGTGKTWAAYVQGIDNGANGRSAVCKTPAEGAADPDHQTGADNSYASWSNPFLYFKSVAASPNCAYEIFGLGALDTDLKGGKSPAFSMVIPDRCHDGSDTPCAPGAPAGLATSDAFLSDVVPKIMGSADYQDGGVIAITFDQSPQGAADSDTSSCCDQPAYPNLIGDAPPATSTPTGSTGATDGAGATGATGATGQTGVVGPFSFRPRRKASAAYVKTLPDGTNAGGGKVGLLLISPYIKAGNTDFTDNFNHYSLLLSIENWFGAPKLGFTSQIGTTPLPDSLLSSANASGSTGSAGR